MSPMVRTALAIAALTVVTASAASAQHLGGSHKGHGGGHSPYAGQDARTIASFSEEERMAHIAGRGLGYARPAELNGYPGPMHVLELKSELDLSPDQIRATEALFVRMSERAKAAGARYMEAEKAVDAAFRNGSADAAAIAGLVRVADAQRAEKRLAHLEAHVEMATLLNAEQRRRYAALRGYGKR